MSGEDAFKLYDTYGFYKNNYDIDLGKYNAYRPYLDKYLKRRYARQ